MQSWAETELLIRLQSLEDGGEEPLLGCRNVVALFASLPPELARSSSATVFRAIVSETEEIPTESMKSDWDAEAFAAARAEGSAYFSEVRASMLLASRELAELINQRNMESLDDSRLEPPIRIA